MPLALFQRSKHYHDLARLAETHLQNDLTQENRDVLKGTTKTVRLLGCFLAYRVRQVRRSWGADFKTQEMPRQIIFDSGRTSKSLSNFVLGTRGV